MDSSIPSSAAKLLDLIGKTEAPKGYDVLFGNNQAKWPEKLTSMTVNDVIAAGPTWSKKFGSSAAGRYQFMNATLKSLKSSESLTGKEEFDANLQDRLGYALLDRRGYEKFAAGQKSVIAFGLALAQEWASFPVLEDCQGANRPVKRGETYYAGDGLNKALISPETVEAILKSHPKALTMATFEDAGSAAAYTADKTAARLMAAFAAATGSAASGDAGKIAQLVGIASDPTKCAAIREKGKNAMIPVYGKPTVKNACAATLCCFLDAGGIAVPIERGAGALAHYLEHTRGWTRIKVADQKAGDVAVCFDKTAPAGADHIYLVVKRIDDDEMLIADNQTDTCPHPRNASGKAIPPGHGQTAVEYFLRAENNLNMMIVDAERGKYADISDDEVVYEDEPTDNLEIRFKDDGSPL